ncbi:MAG: hypothetical protein M3349_07575, partial [Actinomycetota bacterium]|nr:hypothetical protein [Actinomycetota bacterium]
RSPAPLPIKVTLTAVVGHTIRSTTGSVAVKARLTATQRPVFAATAGLTQVQHQLIDPGKAPQHRVHVRARLIAADHYLGLDAEITAAVETYSDIGGLLVLNLTPTSQLAPGAKYEITWPGVKRLITVPDSGPVWLENVDF